MMTSPSILLFTSSDQVSLVLLEKILQPFCRSDFLVVEDQSLNPGKIFRLIKNKKINPFWLVQQSLSGFRQRQALAKETVCQPDIVIKGNKELLACLEKYPNIRLLLAYRAGLLVGRKVIEKVECVNVHYARLPDYAGLQAISRALKNRDYVQKATVHHMVPEIDAGEVILTTDYRLSQTKPYWQNELTAAEAGVEAAQCFLRQKLKELAAEKTSLVGMND